MWRTNAQIHPWLQLDMRESVRVVKVRKTATMVLVMSNVMEVMVMVVKVRGLTSWPLW